ncbi:N-acetylmuramoyl-L-alanine amidase [Agriterribacter sp.]|uniref:N-acetylmuramoyl-L-alanine amidase family protein n=1 Tax=Agriterribacter sp. TaxID=2821509 RepID=UPI002BFE14E6|nr:N-acetylmuramoyl-L-alanine amidase [Agriterribacter sp.]HTN06229.1 N-acetylmuramoyl-L-alanine amidase [Agriterribacter sp.]
MKKKIIAASFFLFSFFISLVCFSQSQSRIKTIIVDAGHGGVDQGAKGSYSTEAQITLQLALKVGALLEKELPETKIIQTRTSDITQPVREKAAFANENKGDLFICIHVNAAPAIRHSQVTGYRTRTYYTGKGSKRKKHTKKEPVYKRWTTPNPRYGTGTYVWAADRDTHKADAVSERFESEGELTGVPDPSTPEGAIASRLWVQKYFKNSVRLASMIESEFEQNGRKSDGVLQRNEKGIWVLQATNMPAVLIETGFITNKDEEDYLNSEKGQNEMSAAIVKAIVNFKNVQDNLRNAAGVSNAEAVKEQPSLSSSGSKTPEVQRP